MTKTKFILFISIVLLCACSNKLDGDMDKTKAIEIFIIAVSNASYDQINNKAVITLNRAFQKSQKIKSYEGKSITVTYRDKEVDIDQCPNINTHLKNIQRDIDFVHNSVTLTVSNVTQELASSIENAQCFSIDASILKKVSDLYFTTSDYI